MQKRRGGGSEDNVILLKQKIGQVGSVLKNKERSVGMRSDKAKTMCVMSKPLVPSSQGLLEAIEGFFVDDTCGGEIEDQ